MLKTVLEKNARFLIEKKQLGPLNSATVTVYMSIIEYLNERKQILGVSTIVMVIEALMKQTTVVVNHTHMCLNSEDPLCHTKH